MFKLVVLSCLVAAASASGLAFPGVAPLAYSAPLAYTAPLAYSAPIVAPNNYRGPLSLAPGQPANILAADGRPLDTLDVNLDRSAHFTAKALDGVHFLKKRSVALAAPVVAPYSSLALTHGSLIAPTPLAYSAPIIAPHNYRGPLSLAPGQPANILAADGRPLDTIDVNLDRSAHYTAKALSGVHYLKKRSVTLAAPVIAPVSRLALTHGSLIAPAPLAYSAPIAHHYASPLSPLTYAAPLIHY